MSGVTNFRNTSFHCSLYFSLFPAAYSCKSGLPNCSNWILSLFFCHLYVKFIYLLDILNIFLLTKSVLCFFSSPKQNQRYATVIGRAGVTSTW